MVLKIEKQSSVKENRQTETVADHYITKTLDQMDRFPQMKGLYRQCAHAHF